MEWIVNISGNSKKEQRDEELIGVADFGSLRAIDNLVASQSPLCENSMKFIGELGHQIYGSGTGMGRWDFDVLCQNDQEMILLVENLTAQYDRWKQEIWWTCRNKS